MLGGTPAMGIGYEDKTKQIFKQLDLSTYQTSCECESQVWIETFDKFLIDLPLIQHKLAPAAATAFKERQNLV